MEEAVCEEYEASLSDLTFNSKPLINMLTMLAEDNASYAEQVVKVIEAHLLKVPAQHKLPCLYLIDSILKNVKKSNYVELFQQNMVSTFVSVFEKVNEETRGCMYKLRQTWASIFSNKKLYAIDYRVNQIDPAWPITAPPPTKASIHVNPKFINKTGTSVRGDGTMSSGPAPMITPPRTPPSEPDEALTLQQQLISKQAELLKLQQQQLEMELAATKSKLDVQARRQQLLIEQEVKKRAPAAAAAAAAAASSAAVKPVASMSAAGNGRERMPVLQTIAVAFGGDGDGGLPSTDPRLRGSRIQDPRLVARVSVGAAAASSVSISDSIARLQESIMSGSLSTPQPDEHKPSVKTKQEQPAAKQEPTARQELQQPATKQEQQPAAKPEPTTRQELKVRNLETHKDNSALSRTSLMSLLKSTAAKGATTKSDNAKPASSGEGRRAESGKHVNSRRTESPKRIASVARRAELPAKQLSLEKTELRKPPPTTAAAEARRKGAGEASKRSEKEASSTSTLKHGARTESPKRTRHVASPLNARKREDSKKKPQKTGGTPPEKAAGAPPPPNDGKRREKLRDAGRGQQKDARRRNYRTSRDRYSESPELKLQLPHRTYSKAEAAAAAAAAAGGRQRAHSPHGSSRSPRSTGSSAHSPSQSASRELETTEPSQPSGALERSHRKRCGRHEKGRWREEAAERVRRRKPDAEEALSNISDISSEEMNEEEEEEVEAGEPPEKRPRDEMDEVIDDRLSSRDDLDMRRPQRGGYYAKRGSPLRSPSHVSWKKYKAAHPIRDFKIPMKKRRAAAGVAAPGEPAVDENARDVDMRDSGAPGVGEKRRPGKPCGASGDVPVARPPLREFRPADPRGTSRRGHYGTRVSIEQDLQIPKALHLAHQGAIMEQAESQLRSGKLSEDQHRELLKQLDELYKLQRRHLQMGGGPREVATYSTTPVKPRVIDHAHGTMREKGPALLPTPPMPPRLPPAPAGPAGTPPHDYRGERRPPRLLPDPSAPAVFRGWADEPAFRPKYEPQGRHEPPPRAGFRYEQPGGPRFDAQFPQRPEQHGRPPPQPSFPPRYDALASGERASVAPPRYNASSSDERASVALPHPPMSVFPGVQAVREMYLDNELREIRFFGPVGVVLVGDVPREVRFEGAPRPVFIDGRAIELRFGATRDVDLDGQPHRLRFGGPTRELLVDGYPFELRFGGMPVVAVINGHEHEVRIGGPAPEIVLGGERPELRDAIEEDMRMRRRAPSHDAAASPPYLPGERAGVARVPCSAPCMSPPPTSRMHGGARMTESSAVVAYAPPVVVVGDPRVGFSSAQVSVAASSQPPTSFGVAVTTTAASKDACATMVTSGDVDLRELLKQREPTAAVVATPGQEPHQEAPVVPQDQDDRVGPPPKSAPTVESESPASPEPTSENGVVVTATDSSTNHTPAYMPPAGTFPVESRQAAQPPAPVTQPSTLPAVSTFGVDVNSLFTKLVASGIISASKDPAAIPEKPAASVKAEASTPEAAAAAAVATPPTSVMGMSHVDTMRALDLLGIVKSKIQVKPQPEQLEHVPHLTKWDTRKLRTYYTGVVDILYVGVQCASCGMRFRAVQNQQYAEHLDWHFRQNRKDKDLLKRATSRKWYYDLEDWIQYEEIEDLEARRSHFFEQQMEEAAAQRHAYRSQTTEPISCITASPSGNNHCEICREEFEQFWDEDEEEWKLKNAIRVDGKAYHPGCYDDGRRSSALDEASADDQGPSTVDAGSIKQEGSAPEKAALQSPPELPKFTPLSTASVEIPGISIMEEGEGEGEESAGVAVKPEPMDAETAEVSTAVKQEPEASMQQEDMHSRVAEKLEAVCSSGDVQHHVVQHDVVQHGVAAHRAGAVAHEPAVVVKPETEPTTTAVQGSALVVKPEPGTAVVQESAVVVKSETEHAVVVQELAVLVNAEAEPATIVVQPSVLVSKAEPAEIVSQEFLVAVKPEVKIDDKFAHNSSAPVVEPQHELAAPPAPLAVVKEEPMSDQEEEGDVDMEEPGRPGGSLSPAAAVNAVEEPATNKDGVSVELSPGTPVRDEQPPSSATPIRDEPMDALVDLVIPVAEATEELPGEAVPRT